MKRLIVAILVAVVVLIPLSPVMADAPVEEQWYLGGGWGGLHKAYLNINTTNLQISSFRLVNNIPEEYHKVAHLEVVVEGEIIWMMLSYPGEDRTVEIPFNLKFHRLPLTDPDDPGSIRYPNKTNIQTGIFNY